MALKIGMLAILAGFSSVAAAAAEPEVVVCVYLKTSWFALRDIQFKVFFNKFETKFLPLPNYDFKENFLFDFMDALAVDRRARWRRETPEDKLDFVTLWDKKNPPMPPGLKADGVLLVFFWEYGADPGRSLYVGGEIKLLNRRGKQVWKKAITRTEPEKKTVEEWILEDPAVLKARLNDLQEKVVKAACAEIAKEKLTP